ncbi:ATP-binding protein [Actinomycetospora endophytica]|uniref:ATP-binding protein n=1 Tax=Actinomycetospora endophytica TaxID=2291215 RepID=A0ABS8PAT5_9PSEU|nr:ATP-binding protein [Actinomycetospora endophytica]MCD2195361.1 ATP-binding protein [Actinomycetospora endophytica]
MPNSDTPDVDVAPWPAPLRLRTPALSSHVRGLRRRLSRWLPVDHFDVGVVEDLVAAVSEALENCCDHAFADAAASGTMTLSARTLDECLRVSVVDDGVWQIPDTGPTTRGRGIAMIRALIDDVVISSGLEGTQVDLTHHVPGCGSHALAQ